VLGETRDDAVGEAFDKVAKLLGLPYPGGPALSKLAQSGGAAAFAFPRPMADEAGYDFSYSGLKTAVALAAQREPERAADLAASFEAAATDVLVAKTRRAAREEGLARVAVVGGVAANSRLRRELAAAAERDGFALFLPPLALCTDNAAMIAAAGARLLARGVADSLALSAFSRVELAARPWAEARP
jgi:N6-L-threonylcarbamoyladenine synthase